MSHVSRRVAALAVGVTLVHGAELLADVREYDFKDPKGVNTVSFTLDSLFEPIMGLASGVSGKVTFDAADPKKTAGRITVEAKTLHTQNKGMTDTLHGSDWLDVKKNPTIEFTFKEIKEVKRTADNTWELTALGDFTCKGVTKPITATVTATHHPGKLGDKFEGKKGDLLVLRSTFTIQRADFGIKPEATGNTIVGQEIEIRVGIVGVGPDR